MVIVKNGKQFVIFCGVFGPSKFFLLFSFTLDPKCYTSLESYDIEKQYKFTETLFWYFGKCVELFTHFETQMCPIAETVS